MESVPMLAASAATDGRLVKSLSDSGKLVRIQPDWELETKFEISRPGSAADLLTVALAQTPQSVLIDRVRDGSTSMSPVYLEVDGYEYSYFDYLGQPLLKIKKHTTMWCDDHPVMVSSETFENAAVARDWALENAARCLGPLEKSRAKVFLLDLSSSQVFSAAVTVCTIEDKEQRQLEIEYYGSVVTAGEATSTHSDAMNLRDIATLVVETSRRITTQLDSALLKPTTETKFEFLQHALRDRGVTT